MVEEVFLNQEPELDLEPAFLEGLAFELLLTLRLPMGKSLLNLR